MDLIMLSFQIILLAIFFQGFASQTSVCISSQTRSLALTANFTWADKVSVISPNWTHQQCSFIECSVFCLNGAYCMSFFYNDQTLQCQGHNTQLTDSTASTPGIGWSYYAVICKRPGYTYVREFNTCFKIFMQPLQWQDAGDVCVDDGGNMIILPNINKYNYFVNLLRSDPVYTSKYWIGLNDINEEGTFVWSQTGENVDIMSTLWRPNEPGYPNTLQNCVQIVPNDYGMDDNECTDALRYICEMPQ